MSTKREFGDYQTPEAFAQDICCFLKNDLGISPQEVLEPTCGRGNFLRAATIFDAKTITGIEINNDYCKFASESSIDNRIKVIHGDYFDVKTKGLNYSPEEHILIIGNPPWVTNSTLSTLNSSNLPEKSNIKGLRGLDALTGSSNFDICEYIILDIILRFKDNNATVAMLCKTSVARNIFQEISRRNIHYNTAKIFEFDATKVFGINASACLLVIQMIKNKACTNTCEIARFDAPNKITKSICYDRGRLLDKSVDMSFDGKCCFVWRQGVKHDCAKIMELTITDNGLVNGNHELVQIEDDYVFPLIKSSMFKAPLIHSFSKNVIVTQKYCREDTMSIQSIAPKTWEYLNNNKSDFDKRKSSVYRDAPTFSMFGVGDYSYTQYKVGVSGFYKKPLFALLYSDDQKPVMTDDTSYFICFDSFDNAYTAMLVLNSYKTQSFLQSISFSDSKRPFTKKVLERLDFSKILQSLSYQDLKQTESLLNLPNRICNNMYEGFKTMVSQLTSRTLFD